MGGCTTMTTTNTATNQAGQPIPIPIPGGGVLARHGIHPGGKVPPLGGRRVRGAGEVDPVKNGHQQGGKALPLALGPDGIGVHPGGKNRYVLNFGTGRVAGRTVTPIRIATLRADRAIKVGVDPDDLAIAR